MKKHLRAVASSLACAALLAGCESLPQQPNKAITDFNQIGHKGVIYYKTHIKSTYARSAPNHGIIPVFIGGVIVPIPIGPGIGPSTTAFYLYYVRLNDGSLLSVAYPGEIADSTCVEVLIQKDAVPKDGYKLGEAVLKPTEQCS